MVKQRKLTGRVLNRNTQVHELIQGVKFRTVGIFLAIREQNIECLKTTNVNDVLLLIIMAKYVASLFYPDQETSTRNSKCKN